MKTSKIFMYPTYNLFSCLIHASDIKHAFAPFFPRYLRCRSEMLQAISQMVDSCRSLRTSPPPAIASTQAKQSHDDLQRCGRISQVDKQTSVLFPYLFSTVDRRIPN